MADSTQTPPSSDLPPVQQPPAARPAEDPEVARLRSEVTRSRQDLDALKARFTAPPQPVAQPAAGMSPAEMAREFYKDPVGHAAAIANRVVEDRLRAEGEPNRQTMIQLARDATRAKDPALFDKYYLEIEAAVNTVAPQFQGNLQVWDNALRLAKGNHIDEIIADRAAEAAKQQPQGHGAPAIHIREGGGPESPSARSAAAPSTEELSKDEKYTAKKLGLTDDQYRAGKKAVDGQNDIVRDPTGPSSWDELVTFDSRERRRKMRAAQRKAS